MEEAADCSSRRFYRTKPNGLGRVSRRRQYFLRWTEAMIMTSACTAVQKIYIFDDSFSALIIKRMRNFEHLKETTESAVLIVAQRVGTIMHADKIVVLNERCCRNWHTSGVVENCPNLLRYCCLTKLTEGGIGMRKYTFLKTFDALY